MSVLDVPFASYSSYGGVQLLAGLSAGDVRTATGLWRYLSCPQSTGSGRGSGAESVRDSRASRDFGHVLATRARYGADMLHAASKPR